MECFQRGQACISAQLISEAKVILGQTNTVTEVFCCMEENQRMLNIQATLDGNYTLSENSRLIA